MPLGLDPPVLGWLARRWRTLSPPTLLVASFAVLIAIGTLGLMTLPALQVGPRLGFVDALFTMTSAVCVTGLIVVDTATRFTFLGQLWLLVFIQLGGIGLITIATLIIDSLGRRLSLRSEMIAVAVPQGARGGETGFILRGVVAYTLGIEAVGAFLLWLAWRPSLGEAAVWHAIFQSVSAFCNAGFSTFSDSLVGFAARPAIVIVISILILLGGFGYLSTAEIVRWSRAREAGSRRRLSTHTYAALSVTVGLLVASTLCFAALEWDGVLGVHGAAGKLLNAWFMAVTPRTAGFNTIAYDQVSNVTACVTLFLMFIGGSPGSAAGGVKTTTLAVLGALVLARTRGRRHVEINRRTVPEGTVQRVVSLSLFAFALVGGCVLVLSLSETHGQSLGAARQSFLPLMFEAVSAFGTVGLSMGPTPELSTSGRLLVILLMFVGRVGPLSFFAAVALKSAHRPAGFRSAHEDLIVG